jgi:hypothetical protein
VPAPDLIHDAVRRALIKDGWAITADPYRITFEDVTVLADLGAERPFAAERGAEKIVVEVKSFVGRSLIRDLELALGQYALYRGFLEVTAPDRTLFLAVSHLVYGTFFQQRAVQFTVARHQLALIVVNLESEEIVEWRR